MYPEITSQVRKAKELLDGHFHLDARVEQVLRGLISSVEFLAGKVWEQDEARPKRPVDPHRYIPGSDD